MEPATTVSWVLAFTAGLLSFVSPCVLPLVPAYVSYITGLTLDDLTSNQDRARIRAVTIKNSLLFILGFSVIFIAFGATATMLGQMVAAYQSVLRRVGGAVVILFGLYIMGALKLPFLSVYKQYQFQDRPAGGLGTMLVGVAFAAGWTPCVGPILGTILLYAGTSDSLMKGVMLLVIYSVGLGLPFFLTSLGVNSFLASYQKFRPYLYLVSWISGVFLIAIGLLIFTNSFSRLAAWLTQHGIGWAVGQ
jgi:cytochrome c-type biogenesis protein